MKSFNLTLFIILLLALPSFATIGPISGLSSLCVGNFTTLADTSLGGTWSSSYPGIANIDSASGVVTGISSGLVTITYVKGISFSTKVLLVNPLPNNTYSLFGGGTFCAGGPGAAIHLSGSDTGVTYQLFYGGVPVGLSSVGTGAPIDLGFSPIPATVRYDVECRNNVTACESIISAYITSTEITTACIGTPTIGPVSASATVVCPDTTLTLNLPILVCGVSYQWQTSPNDTVWTNLSGATTIPYTFNPTISQYYRAKVTCLSSGLFAYSESVYVTINSSIQFHSVISNPDTICNGPVFLVSTCSYTPGLSITSWFGDGTSSNTVLTASRSTISHIYSQPGTYSIKEVLYHYTTPIDSVAFSYEYLYCRTLPVKLFYDSNNDSLFDFGDNNELAPVKVEIDSNGILIDSIWVTSGFYYLASGGPGTVYSFKVLMTPGGFHLTYPSSGVLYDTIQPYVNNYQAQYFGFYCGSGGSYNLGEYASLKCGYHMANGSIFVNNSFCTPESAALTVNFSPKYTYGWAYPVPTSHTLTSMTWNLGTLSSSLLSYPVIDFGLDFASGYLTIGDTVYSSYSIAPTTGDVDTTNNFTLRIDTVRAGYDPNEMSVAPNGNILPCTPLQYTINFENTGNAPATNIYVMDTLSDDVDNHSLKIITASAAMNISLLKDGVHNIVRFDFPGINLLDSSHHGQCDGMVIFTVKTKNDLPNGTAIYNQAGIFFDDNPAVMTEAVINTIGISPITGAGHVCNTASILLTDNTVNGTWSCSNSNATVNAGLVTGVAVGTDIITYTVANSCSSETATQMVTIEPIVIPALTIYESPVSGDTICAGIITTFNPNPLNGGSSPTYSWMVNSLFVDSSSSYCYIPSNGDVITSKLTSSATCAIPDTAIASFTMTVLANVIPDIMITALPGNHIYVGQTDTFVAEVSNGGSSPLNYQWNINGNPIPGATSSSFVYSSFFENDVLTCDVIANSMCGTSSSSNTVTITIYNVGVSTLITNDKISIYPNPVTDELIIADPEVINEISISNLIGKTLYNNYYNNEQVQIDVSNLPSGIYFIKINGTEVRKFVKE